MKKKWIVCLLTATLAAAMFFGSFSVQCSGIRENVVRLHVLANSDSDADQALKLEVRDAVTKEAAGLFDGVATAADALQTAEAALPRLQSVAETAVRSAGYSYPVEVELCRMYFNTRTYDDAVTLPAGVYDALRVRIGEAAGHNWWCVVFPPLCVGAAADASTLEDVLDGEQLAVVTGGKHYAVRFKVVEWWESLCHTVRGWFGEE